MAVNTSKIFTTPPYQRFTCSALSPLESTSNYLSRLSQLLETGLQSRAKLNPTFDYPKKLAKNGMENKLMVSLETPTISKTASLARIYVYAFAEDRCVQLMYSASNHWQALISMVKTRYNDRDFGLKLAVTKHEGRNAGWIGYSLVGLDVPTQDDVAYLAWTTAAACLIESAEEEWTRTCGIAENHVQRDRRRKLWKVISGTTIDALSQLPHSENRTGHVIINTLVVDPACRGRGIGTELLKWATDYADRKGIAVWAQVSTAAHGLLEAAGFEEVQTLVLDLDDHYYGEEEKGSRLFGVYEIKYMFRKTRKLLEVQGSESLVSAALK